MTHPEDVLTRGYDERQYAGVLAQVVRDGELVHRAVVGEAFADGPVREPLWEGALFDIASCTKAVATTATLMTLVDRGELSVDEPLSRFVTSPDPRVTLRQLLTHRAGLVEWQPLYLVSDSREQAVAVTGSLVPTYDLGVARHYSDLGFILLGAVVERVTGMRLDEAVAACVTDPLQMSSTRFGPVPATDAVANGRGDDVEQAMIRDGEPYPVTVDPTSTVSFRRGWVRGEVSDGNAFHAMAGISGHAGLFSTLDDLTRFGSALLDGRLWSPAVREQFLQPGPDHQAIGFWWLPAAGGPAYGHPGFTGARFLVDPVTRSVAVLLSNRLHVMAPGERVPPDIAPVWLGYLAATGFTRDG